MNFEYNEVKMPSDCTFRISPSQIYKFFSLPSVWYRENFLDEKLFEGNTATELGTIIHAAAEAISRGEPVERVAIENYIDTLDEERIDVDEIRLHYKDMMTALINEYIIPHPATRVEYATLAKVLDDIYVGGTVDNRTGDTIVDYKNVSIKPNTDSIPFQYLIQLLAYAYADKAQGIETTRLRIVYTVRRTKTLPVRVFVVNKEITSEDWELIEKTLMLIALTVKKHREDESLIPLLYKSLSL